MENEVGKRIAKLEKEVLSLRLELDELKANKSLDGGESLMDGAQAGQQHATENHLVKLNKQALPPKKEMPINTRPLLPDHQVKSEPVQRSLEEIILWLLPKVFMLILVLGVLWGLKVISDFGVLTNGVKILLAYILSLALIAIAIILDKKRPESSAIYTIVLYGGAFIVGILTTAAGAILYGVLPLTLALTLALAYIAYGIYICYLKKNEVLSIFVLFTSLLLPYLLEYMDFNGAITVLYVLIVYSSMQWIFIKHGQSIAMYCSYFFSAAALFIIWTLNAESTWLYPGSLILLNTLLLLVWWRLYKPYSKRRTIHEGLLFSLGGLTVVLINEIAKEAAAPLLTMAIVYSSMAVFAFKRNESRVTDISATLAMLTVINVIVILELAENLELLLLPFAAFSGLILAIKLDAIVMKVVYSLVFAYNILVQIMFYEVRPFWTVEHLNYVLILIYLAILYWMLKWGPKARQGEGKGNYQFSRDVFPVLLLFYFFIYAAKIDLSYLSNGSYPYAALLLVALVMLVSFIISEELMGNLVKRIMIFAFALGYIALLPTHFVDGIDIWVNLFTRFVYAAILIAITADLHKRGFLYRRWQPVIKMDIDSMIALGIVTSMLLLYSILEQSIFENLISPLFAITLKTLILFLTATISLWISGAEQYRKVRITGYLMIAIAMIKLFFFDLDSLNLIIRAILFMLIGAIGLLLSNRLLTKNGRNEK